MSLLSNKIVACTSEDGSHPVRELLDFHAQSRGWQSARWSEYPQALVLQFPTAVMLQQVQVLRTNSRSPRASKSSSATCRRACRRRTGVRLASNTCDSDTFRRLK